MQLSHRNQSPHSRMEEKAAATGSPPQPGRPPTPHPNKTGSKHQEEEEAKVGKEEEEVSTKPGGVGFVFRNYLIV